MSSTGWFAQRGDDQPRKLALSPFPPSVKGSRNLALEKGAGRSPWRPGALITRAGCASSLCSGPAPSLPAEGCGVGSETLAGREALCLQSVAPAPAKQSKIYENVAIWGVLVCLCMVSPNGVESKAFTCPYRQVG